MKLQRYAIYTSSGYVVLPGDCRKEDDGAWVYAPDVADLLASIREAVDAERAAASEQQDEYTVWHLQCVRCGQDNVSPGDVNRAERDYDKARAALDALLSGEG